MSDSVDNTFSAYLGQDFQQRLMWQLLVEPEFAEKTIPNLAIEYFDDPHLKRLFIIILEYFKEFEKVPNLQNKSIQQAISLYKTPNNKIEEESLFSVLKRIELWNERVLNKQMYYDGAVIQKSTNDFIKQQEYRKLAEGIISKVKNGDIKKKTEIFSIEEKFQKISHIGEEEDYGVEVFDNIDKALRKEFRETIPTGVDVIDALTGGGLGKSEIGLILTPSGVGKTTLLTKIANSALDCKKNVLQIVFEDTIEQIQRKHFTIWAKSKLSLLVDDDENQRVNDIAHKKTEGYRKIGGKIVIKRFSQENTTMMDIRNWIIRHQKKFGYKFDIVVLDYLDCLESHKRTSDRNEAELVIIKSFEAMASDFNIPCWSAIQSNRTGFDAEFVEAYQTGGSIKRIQKAHFFMSVAKTRDQKEAQLANIRIIKARFAQDGQTFQNAIFNNDTMEIRIEDDRYKFSRVNKEAKHHDSEDLEKLDEKANKATITDIHTNINEKIGDTPIDVVSDAVNDAVSPPVRIRDLSPHDINNLLENNKNKDDTLIDIDGEVEQLSEEDRKTEGVSEGTNEGVNTNEPDLIINSWTGETFYNNVNETEVEFKETKSEENHAEISPKIDEKPQQIINNLNISDIESKLIDPDELHSDENPILDLLNKLRMNQKVMDDG